MDATDRWTGTLRRGIGFALIAVMAFAAMTGGAAAHSTDADHGELTFYDERDGEGQQALSSEDEPVEVRCEFWVEGTNMTHAEGELHGIHSRVGPSIHGHDVAEWEAQPDGNGTYEFLVGPIRLHTYNPDMQTDDTWIIRANTADGQHSTPHHDLTYSTCSEEAPPACPQKLRAHAEQDESVRLGWNAPAEADAYHVYRATEDGERQHVAEVNDTAYTDNTTEAGTTYTYEVTAANEAGEAEDCSTAEATAIPFFGHPALVAMAAIGSVGVVAAMRVRRG